MNVLGMGPLELVLIVVLALIVFGPAKLPEIMGQVGRAIGDFRRATSELSDEFNRTIQAELNESKQVIEETKSALTEVHSAVTSTMTDTQAAMTGLPAPQRIAAPTTSAVESNGTAEHPETSTNGSSAPPLADTSQWSWETSPARTDAEGVTTAEAPVEQAGDETPAAEALTTSEAVSAEGEAASNPEKPDSSTPPRERTSRDELLPPY